MTRNPLINALAALSYIVAVSTFMFYGTQKLPKEDTVFAPIAALSILTLSAAFMGYVFFFQPIQLYLDGKKKQAVDLFLKTLVFFGVVTVIVLLLLFSGVYKTFLSL